MTTHAEPRVQLEQYLVRVRSALGRMPEAEKAAIGPLTLTYCAGTLPEHPAPSVICMLTV